MKENKNEKNMVLGLVSNTLSLITSERDRTEKQIKEVNTQYLQQKLIDNNKMISDLERCLRWVNRKKK